MPRIRKSIVTVKDRLNVKPTIKLRKAQWIDPFPNVLGTRPEKILFARLTFLRIPFIFQGYTTINIPELDLVKDYRPDFIIPAIKLIIEVQGSYWHSKPEAIESDAYKYALYQAMGYRVATWWDWQIETNLDALFATEPELDIWTRERGGRIIQPDKQSYRDDLKGLRTLNRKRRTAKISPTTSRRKIRKSSTSYVVY